MKINKAIVTNKAALKAKYGKIDQIETALKALIASDKKRGLHCKVIDVSSAAEMKKFKGSKVTNPANERQNKNAVDRIFAAGQPDYIVLLGAIDVIPQQQLPNPVYDGDPDDDKVIASDLPYACEAGYSQLITDFKGPTRVVGRLPDVVGATSASGLCDLIKVAAGYSSQPRSAYESCLGITARCWEKSTNLNLKTTFGKKSVALMSPDEGPKWSKTQLGRLSHFINLHGGSGDFQFYGQKTLGGPVLPFIGHDARVLPKAITRGTVVAAECCYGAELSATRRSGQVGICNTYLNEKAYAFFGSSTTAYGPDVGNDQADLITQYFFKYVLEGASTGRATLQARQDYVTNCSPLDPYDLITLAQFSLMGDPAIHPVVREDFDMAKMLSTGNSAALLVAGTMGKGFSLGLGTIDAHGGTGTRAAQLSKIAALLGGLKSGGAKSSAAKTNNQAAGLTTRRDDLLHKGLTLATQAMSAKVDSPEKTSAFVRKVFRDMAGEDGTQLSAIQSFAVERPALTAVPGAKSLKAQAGKTTYFHVGKRRVPQQSGNTPDAAPMPRQIHAIVMREEEGEITAVKNLYSK